MSESLISRSISPEADTLVGSAYDQILLQIVQGTLPSGTKLKTAQLSSELGLSRTPVVQAIQRLIADGIATPTPQKGSVVAEGAENWLVNTHELRLLLEPRAARHAATRLESDVLKMLKDYANASEPAKGRDWIPHAYAFDYYLHTSVARASGNLPLCETICKCMSFKRLTYEISDDSPELLKRDHAEHSMILDALKKQDAETASAAMRYHLTNSLEFRKPGGNII